MKFDPTPEEYSLVQIVRERLGKAAPAARGVLAAIRFYGGPAGYVKAHQGLGLRFVATEEVPQIHIGERGGRYYKRTRSDGTTYREYTW